jgi:exopolyphosphatase/guanosine-5'-triphosphate,3'-diphosphate pyrophosphatase
MNPITLAAADIGSNAIRFLIMQFTHNQRAHVLHQSRESLRLGHDVFLTGSISPASEDRTVAVMTAFAKLLRRHAVNAYRAVATSALRESSNGGAVIDAVRTRSGIEIELIDGLEEARLAFVAIRSRLQLAEEPWALADLGGGSLEISRVNRNGISDTVSLPIGAVRLIESVGAGAGISDYEQRIGSFESRLAGAAALQQPLMGMIATGGSADALVRVTGVGVDKQGVSRLPRRTVREAAERLAGTPVADRGRKFGLQADRADVILPAALVYGRVAELVGADHIVVPNVGVKEGIVLDLLATSGS